MSGFWLLQEVLGLVAGYCFDCRSIRLNSSGEAAHKVYMLASTLYVDGTASSSFTLAIIIIIIIVHYIPGLPFYWFLPCACYIDASSSRRGRSCG